MATLTKPHLSPTKTTKSRIIPTEAPVQNGDEIWETLFAMPESEDLILQMEQALEDDILHGRTEKGGFGDAD